MAFPSLSHRQRHPISRRAKRVSHNFNRAPSPSSCASSPQKCRQSRRSARESLRSTMLTNASECTSDDEQDQELQVLVQLQRPLSDWVYWQRDAELLPQCWTRVFAVFCGNLLWLYRYEDASAKSLLLRVRVTALEAGKDNRQLQFRDAATAVKVQLCLPDASAFYRWHSHVATAVAKFPPVQEDANRPQDVVPAVTAAMQKKSFWTALTTAVVASAKSSSHYNGRADVYEQHRARGKKSLGERWKAVTTTLKGALKLRGPHAQLQL